MTRENCLKPSQRSQHLMTDKMTKQLRFVMVPKPEYVMHKTRTNCVRLSQRYRQQMTAQPTKRSVKPTPRCGPDDYSPKDFSLYYRPDDYKPIDYGLDDHSPSDYSPDDSDTDCVKRRSFLQPG